MHESRHHQSIHSRGKNISPDASISVVRVDVSGILGARSWTNIPGNWRRRITVVHSINPKLVTTALELPGHRIVRNVGVVRGIVVRSRSIVGTLGASLQTLIGGNITLYTELCERARQEAFELMLEHASQMGANAVVAMRYDANDVAAGVTEVLAYGTAVVIEPVKP
jgi:uncharacterized protein YbjQ (UPF0145 family)